MRLATPPGDRALLERILSSDELAEAGRRTGWLQSLLDDLLRWLQDLLGSRGAAGFASGVRGLMLAAVLALAAWAVWKVVSGRPGRRARRPEPEGTPLRLDPPERHLERSAAARTRGELRLAMRHRFLATLSRLESERLVGWGRHKTNREYADDLARREAPEPLRATFGALVEAFDACWYAGREVEAEDLAAVEAACARAEAAMGADGRAAGSTAARDAGPSGASSAEAA